MIYFRSVALSVGAVSSLFRSEARNALVKINSEIVETADYRRNAVLNLSFFVGVFNAKIGNAAR